MMGTLKIIMALTVCSYAAKGENVTYSLYNLTENTDYEFSADYEDGTENLDRYKVVTIEPSTDFQNTTQKAETEDIVNGPTTPLVFIKPVITPQTPKAGVRVLTNEDEIPFTPRPVVENSEPVDTEEYEEGTEMPAVTSEAPDGRGDFIDMTSIQMKIEEMTEKLQVNTTGDYVDTSQGLRSLSEVAGAVAILGEEIDKVCKGEEVVSKKLFDLQTQYLRLYQQMEKFNDTLNTIFQQKAEKRVEIALSLLKHEKIIEAAQVVSKIRDNSKIHKMVGKFYEGKRENILNLVNFTYQLENPTKQLVSFHSLFSEMKRHNHSDDPGVLPIHDKIVEIHAFEEFPTIKHDAGVLLYDIFRESVEKEANKVLTEWQSKMQNGEYEDIVGFASKSTIYSESLNNNMIRLLWLPNSFETNNEFLSALPDLNNRVAGYLYLNDVYKNHHRYNEMIKLAVTVKGEFEKNHDFIDENILSEFKRKFWTPVKKLIWSESCFIKNRYTGKYLFEYKNVNDRDIATYSIETVRWSGGRPLGDEASNDFRWGFIPDEDSGKFEIQNKEYLHSLMVEDALDGNFKYWPRRKVTTSNQLTKKNQTNQWTVILSDREEKFSFKSDFGYLTAGGNSSFVYADEQPKIANIPEKEDKMEFLQHHLWDLDCY